MAAAKLRFRAICAHQRDRQAVLSFAASAEEILAIARIERVGRDARGRISGFQRPQVTEHIREIHDYLRQGDAILPNSIVLAFLDGVEVKENRDGTAEVAIDASKGPRGYVVDGQQRLTALSSLGDNTFRVLVSLILCGSEAELKQQFILVNSARPLPKSLIYELLPEVRSLPGRLASRSYAAAVTEALNYLPDSSLRGKINQHSNPDGVIRDTAIQRVIMNSVSDGVLRDMRAVEKGVEPAFRVLSEFYWAVKETFPRAWDGHTPKTSRLIHGTGIVAMGYVMESLHARTGALSREEFRRGLTPLQKRTAWTSGTWRFAKNDAVPWNELQNVSRHVIKLAHYLVASTRSGERTRGRK
ncbi:MAG TPA: DGQHR domain-containing protein DpdB [Usitatibacter sp.]|nr:DGQHR domain-containing protein DpdB [Usitatibacter sp.]